MTVTNSNGPSMRRPQVYSAHTEGLTQVTFGVDGRKIFTAGADNLIRCFEATPERRGEEAQTLEYHSDGITSILTTSEVLLTSSKDKKVVQGDIVALRYQSTLTRSDYPVRSLALQPKRNTTPAQWLAVVSDSSTIQLLDLTSSKSVTLSGLRQPAASVSFHPQGTALFAFTTQGALVRWDLPTDLSDQLNLPAQSQLACGRFSEPEKDDSCHIAVHPLGQLLACPSSTPGEVNLIHTKNLEKFKVLSRGHTQAVTHCTWSPNGNFLATLAQDRSLVIWSTTDWTKLLVLQHEMDLTSIAWSPTTDSLAMCNEHGSLMVYDHILSSRGDFTGTWAKAPPAKDINSVFQPDEVSNELETSFPDLHIAGTPPEDSFSMSPHYQEEPPAPSILPLQACFTPGSTQMESFDWQFLCYSSIGGILACLDSGMPSYNIRFRDTDHFTDYSFNDLRRYSLGSLSSHGALFAMPIEEPHTRNDALPHHPPEDQRAFLFYRPHNDNDPRNRWEAILPEGEDIQTIAATVRGPVITTTTGLARYFSCYGLQYHIAMAPSLTLLSSAASEQWLIHVYHVAAEPGNLRLGFSLIDLASLAEINRGPLTLTPGGALEWIGFSSDGTPACADSEGLVQILLHPTTSRAQWTPVLNIHPGRLFPFGISPGKLHCLRIAADPSWIGQPIAQEIPWKQPAAQMSHGDTELEEKLLMSRIHTQLVLDEDQNDSVSLQAQHLIEDKLLLQLLHVACKAGRPQQVVEFSLMLNCPESLEFAEKLAASVQMTDAVHRIQEIKKLSTSNDSQVVDDEEMDNFPEIFSSEGENEDTEPPLALSSPRSEFPARLVTPQVIKTSHPPSSVSANPFAVKVHRPTTSRPAPQLSTPVKRPRPITDPETHPSLKSPFSNLRQGGSLLTSTPRVPLSQSTATLTPVILPPPPITTTRPSHSSKVQCRLPISDSDSD